MELFAQGNCTCPVVELHLSRPPFCFARVFKKKCNYFAKPQAPNFVGAKVFPHKILFYFKKKHCFKAEIQHTVDHMLRERFKKPSYLFGPLWNRAEKKNVRLTHPEVPFIFPV